MSPYKYKDPSVSVIAFRVENSKLKTFKNFIKHMNLRKCNGSLMTVNMLVHNVLLDFHDNYVVPKLKEKKGDKLK